MSVTTIKYRQREANQQNQKALAVYAQLDRTPQVVQYRDWGNLHRTRPQEQLLPMREADCGTPSGHRAHVRNNETPCQPCKDAHSRDVAESRQKATA